MTPNIDGLFEWVKQGKIKLAHIGLLIYLKDHEHEKLSYSKMQIDLHMTLDMLKRALSRVHTLKLIKRKQESGSTRIIVDFSPLLKCTSAGVIEYTSSIKDTYKAIIEDLNEVSGKAFKWTAVGNQRLIDKRLKEDYNLEDFKKVHRNMLFWLSDAKMSEYYQPSTLYADSHFDNYLNKTHAMDREKRTTDKWKTPEAKERIKQKKDARIKKLKDAGLWDEEED